MNSLKYLTIIALIVSLSACNNDKIVFEQFENVPEGTWSVDDKHTFTFEVNDTTPVYRLIVEFDFSTDYAWENFYAKINTTFPGDTAVSNVVSFEFADKTGSWYGECNATTCKLNIPLQERVKFETPGTYTIEFEQYMRNDLLQGIEGVGLRLVVPAE